jgi:phenylalanyl-tRNA synthetase alpha chain
MLDKIHALRKTIANELAELTSSDQREAFRIRYLGRKGEVAELFKQLKDVAAEQKREVGQELNKLKQWVEAEFGQGNKQDARTAESDTDLTLPGYTIPRGSRHPLSQTLADIKRIFHGFGFRVASGPELESDYYNFEALNLPRDHPARNMQDTLYIADDMVLRTHTSPVQIRVMEKQQPPVRIIAPGRVYRRDTPDASHSPFFHQVEGLVVDRGISFRDLKALIEAFAGAMFGADIRVRFRPSFFPFTEPSLEYDFNCVFCRGEGCRVCQNTGWLEISGAGMVDPNVFGFVNYDPDVYSGYAFGMGIDRITMLRYGIRDIRLLFDNDVRFLRQF